MVKTKILIKAVLVTTCLVGGVTCINFNNKTLSNSTNSTLQYVNQSNEAMQNAISTLEQLQAQVKQGKLYASESKQDAENAKSDVTKIQNGMARNQQIINCLQHRLNRELTRLNWYRNNYGKQ